MEYVDGRSINEYCDERRLGLPARLRLFLQVLDAVQHAHAHLIVHRDLKPSNILVTANDDVRLLDFGIATLLAGEARAYETRLTQSAWRALTPEYASPEQIKGESLTIATDIYSLGVVLYELLVGARPYHVNARLKAPSAVRLEEAIAGADVRRPSSALTDEAARARATPASRLARALSGDLDTIILKALARSPADRYATVAAFADDLQRYLDSRPVIARPPSWSYRVRKWVLRNRGAAGAVVFSILALVIGAALASWQAVEARAEQARTERVKSFLASIFADIDPSTGQGRRVPASAILLKASTRIEPEFGTEPRLALEVASLVADGLAPEDGASALKVITSALDRHRHALPASDPVLLRARVSAVKPHAYAGTFPAVADELPDLIAALRTAGPALTKELVYALDVLASSEVYAGRIESGVAAAAEAANIAIGHFGEQHESTIHARYHWANLLLGTNDLPNARSVAERGLEAAQIVYARPHATISAMEKMLALVLMRSGQPGDAVSLLTRVLDDRLSLYGENTDTVSDARYFLGQALVHHGRAQEGVEILKAGQEGLLRSNPGDHRNMWIARVHLAYAYQAARLPQDALRVLDEADRVGREKGINVDQFRLPRIIRGLALTRAGRYSEAAFEYAALDSMKVPPTPLDAARTWRGLAMLARRSGRPAEGARIAEEALAKQEAQAGILSERAAIRAEWGLASLDLGDLATAERELTTSRSEFVAAQVERSAEVIEVEEGLTRIALARARTSKPKGSR
jgi:eukaryotic-like serine/threonine-protein kinase